MNPTIWEPHKGGPLPPITPPITPINDLQILGLMAAILASNNPFVPGITMNHAEELLELAIIRQQAHQRHSRAEPTATCFWCRLAVKAKGE